MDRYFVAITVQSRSIGSAERTTSTDTCSTDETDPVNRFWTAFHDICAKYGHPVGATAVMMYHEAKMP